MQRNCIPPLSMKNFYEKYNTDVSTLKNTVGEFVNGEFTSKPHKTD